MFHFLSHVPEAFGVEVGQVAAFGAVGGVDDAVDQCRRARRPAPRQGGGELGRRRRLISFAAERLDQPVVAGAGISVVGDGSVEAVLTSSPL